MITDLLWILLMAQMMMGAFDIFYHHEMTERLAWRQSQKQELRLHGIRNFIYAGAFLIFGFAIPSGWVAVVLIIALVIEVIITLIDFVEEDRSRKLPESERVAHTLLALNYGAILALLMPKLIVLAGEPAGLGFMFYGLWSLLVLAGAAGCALFGVRDILAAGRLGRMASPGPVIAQSEKKQHILITGGTGFMGTRLCEALVARGDAVTVLTRDATHAAHLKTPVRIVTGLGQISDDEKFDAIINLAGASIVGGLWTAKYKRKVYRSRLALTRRLVKLMQRLQSPPAVFISGSAIGIYGINADNPIDEYHDPHNDCSFSHRLCRQWEHEAESAKKLGIRTVLLRTGIVLDSSGGTLGQMLPPTELFMGGKFGSGQQWMSWISLTDIVRLIAFCLDNAVMRGAVNGVAPTPVRNAEMVSGLARALNRPALMQVPAMVFERGLGDLGKEIFLGSQNILPTKAVISGFQFEDPMLDEYLERHLAGGRSKKSEKLAGARITTMGEPKVSAPG